MIAGSRFSAPRARPSNVLRYLAGNGYVEELELAKIPDELVADDGIKPMLIVAPDCYNKYRGSSYTNSSVTVNREDSAAKIWSSMWMIPGGR